MWSRRLARRGRSDDAQILKAIRTDPRAGKTVSSPVCAEHGPPGLCAQRSYTPLNHDKADTAKIMTADRIRWAHRLKICVPARQMLTHAMEAEQLKQLSIDCTLQF